MLDAVHLGVSNPSGLIFSSRANAFYVTAALVPGQPVPDSADIFKVTAFAERLGQVRVPAAVAKRLAMAMDNKAHRLLVVLPAPVNKIIAVAERGNGSLDLATLQYTDSQRFVLKDPQGMSIDPVSGRVYILDGHQPRIVVIQPGSGGSLAGSTSSTIDLRPAGLSTGRGLAFDPTTGTLHVVSPADQKLYELSQTGQVVAVRDLSGLGLSNPQGMVFAPSADLTDDPLRLHLFLADSGQPRGLAQAGATRQTAQPQGTIGTTTTSGQVVELSFSQATAAGSTSFQSALVRTINTAAFSPPSPDPSGMTYLPSSNTLLMSDAEVEEVVDNITIFAGVNLWEMTLGGTVVRTGNISKVAPTVVPMTNEPTGVAWNPANGHYYFSDDDGRRVYDLNPGPDGQYATVDDTWTSFDVRFAGNNDAEGITFDTWHNRLFVVDGVNMEVYQYTLTGTLVDQFDVELYGVVDPEGVEFNADSGTLFVLSNHGNRIIIETTTGGALLRTIDVSASKSVAPASVVYAPASTGSGTKRFYISDRGIDNNINPTENDGKIYEMNAPPPLTVGNVPPTVDAGPDQSIPLPGTGFLNGLVSDDGLPNPPADVTTTWRQISGPGTVIFGDDSRVDTTVYFSIPGTYVLRLTASDSELSRFDDVTITATGYPGLSVLNVRVAAGSDDAEEKTNNSVSTKSTDLDLMYDSEATTPVNQIAVGMRFNGIPVPKGATIVNAFVQFTTDEIHPDVTQLTVQGHAVDNAATFTAAKSNISSRLRTAAAVSWSPVIWPTVGDAGVDQRTPNIAGVIQELVNRTGWASNNSLALIITGSGERVAVAYEGAATAAPLLHVEYRTGPPDQPPSVTITAPANGSTFTAGQSITFSGSATDLEDGNVTGKLLWRSSRDGAIGSGGSFSTFNLTMGTHIITAAVMDNGGLKGTAQITLTVGPPNRPPTVTITAPANGSSFTQGQSITFSGSATDQEDGTITAALVWSSDRDGVIGSGGSFSTAGLTVGVHIITATAVDSGGIIETAQIGLTVVAPHQPPSITITAPTNGSSFTAGQSITFSGSATDQEDGDVTLFLVWISDRDGVIGSGASFSTSNLTVGVHTITATATDNVGLTGATQIGVLGASGGQFTVLLTLVKN